MYRVFACLLFVNALTAVVLGQGTVTIDFGREDQTRDFITDEYEDQGFVLRAGMSSEPQPIPGWFKIWPYVWGEFGNEVGFTFSQIDGKEFDVVTLNWIANSAPRAAYLSLRGVYGDGTTTGRINIEQFFANGPQVLSERPELKNLKSLTVWNDVSTQWSWGLKSVTFAVVPEPSALGLTVIGFIILLKRGKRGRRDQQTDPL